MHWTVEQKHFLKKYLEMQNWIELMVELNISADEISLGRLDEDMTVEEYLSYGPLEAAKEITNYYIDKGAYVAQSPRGIKIYGDEEIEPYHPKEKRVKLFSLEERRILCEMGHRFLEKRNISKDEVFRLLNI